METTFENIRMINDEPEFCAFDKTNVSADFFILCEDDNLSLFGKNVYDNQICGLSILNWVIRACGEQPKIIKSAQDDNPIASIRDYVDENKDYSVVFYADTPLLNRVHVLDMLGFVDRKRMSVCKFKRGFIFRNDYILENNEIYSTDTYDFSTDDFFIIKTSDDFSFAREILTKKVLSYHKRNGVYFENEQNVTIDANTNVGIDCDIFSGASLTNGTIVGSNVKIQKNATIVGSRIGDNVAIGIGTIVLNSIIKNGAIVGDGVVVKDSVVGNNVKIEFASKIISSSVRDGVVIKENVLIDESKICENSIINKHSQVLGITDKSVIGRNTEIGANCLVQDSVIQDDEFIDIGSIIKNKVGE